MTRRNGLDVLTGAAVIVLAAGFLFYAIAHSGRGMSSGYPLVAKFDHVDGMPDGADVRIAGVKVGSVVRQRIDPENFMAVVTLTVQDGIKLPKDSSAEITSESLLGGKYVSIVPGGDTATLRAGDEITITQGSVSLEQLLGKFIFSLSSAKTAAKPADAAPAPAGEPK